MFLSSTLSMISDTKMDIIVDAFERPKLKMFSFFQIIRKSEKKY